MTIYVSHSKSFDFEKELYNPLRSSPFSSEHTFIFPHEGQNQAGLDAKKLFSEKKCDLVLAEVTHPATGQGIELAWAETNNIPIICIFKKGSKVSDSLKRVSSTFIEYSSANELILQLTTHISDLL